MPITPHAKGVKQSSSLSQFAKIILSRLVCNDGSALTTSKASSNFLNNDTYRCVCLDNCVVHPDK